MAKNDLFERISPNEALKILRQLAKSDKKLKAKIMELAQDLITEIDVEEVSGGVFFALDIIDVHDLWDQAGPSRDGYISSEDMAFEMVEETLEPFHEELKRLLDLKMYPEAKLYCMGLLKGLYLYQKESESEFKDWATDIPGECFGEVLRKWVKGQTDEDKKEMRDFIAQECPEWTSWASKEL